MDSAKVLRELKDALDAKGIDRSFYIGPISEGSPQILDIVELMLGTLESTILAEPSTYQVLLILIPDHQVSYLRPSCQAESLVLDQVPPGPQQECLACRASSL